MLLPTVCANFRKIKPGKKLANTHNASFWENGQKIGERSNIEILCSQYLDIVIPYKCAKFGNDRFGNDGATFFRFYLGLYRDDIAVLYTLCFIKGTFLFLL